MKVIFRFGGVSKILDDLLYYTTKIPGGDFVDSYEFTVGSEIYGETVCVVDISAFLKGRKVFCCADGCDYRLRKDDIAKIIDVINKNELHI